MRSSEHSLNQQHQRQIQKHFLDFHPVVNRDLELGIGEQNQIKDGKQIFSMLGCLIPIIDGKNER